MNTKTLLGAAAFAALLGASASAADRPAPVVIRTAPAVLAPTHLGDLTLYGGWGSDYTVGAVQGRFEVPHGAGFLMPEVSGQIYDYGFGILTGALHYYRKSTVSAHGVFVGATHENDCCSENSVVVGVEGAWFTHPNSIISAYGFVGTDFDEGFGEVTAKWDYFFHPNTKASLRGAAFFGFGGTNSVGEARITHRFMDTPLSVFGVARVTKFTGDSAETSFRVGLTLNFDPPGTTQLQHDIALPFQVGTTIAP